MRQAPRESFSQYGLPKPSGALEIGRNDCFELLNHTQSSLHFRNNSLLLSERREWNRNLVQRGLREFGLRTAGDRERNVLSVQESGQVGERDSIVSLYDVRVIIHPEFAGGFEGNRSAA
jgi:hypothetical protein